MTPVKDTIVYHHGNCNDGFGSALAAWMKYGEFADYIPLSYGDKMPDPDAVIGKNVLVLDFCFDRDLTYALAAAANEFTLLDHHVGSMNKFKPKDAGEDLRTLEIPLDNGSINFDMAHSGAVMTWEYLHGVEPMPQLFKFVQEYDLGRTFDGIAIEGTEAYIRRLEMENREFGIWDDLSRLHGAVGDAYNAPLKSFMQDGELLLKSHDLVSSKITERGVTKVILNGIEGLMINGGQEHVNMIGHILSVRSGTFGMLWTTDGEKVKISLRANGRCDVNEIAAAYNGNGHKNAAGIVMTLAEFLPILQGERS